MSKLARQVLNHHGKSFSLGGVFLPQKTLDGAAVLYHFCRYCDDTADDVGNMEEKRQALQDIRGDLQKNQSSHPIISAYLQLAHKQQIPRKFPVHLLDGLLSDQEQVHLTNHNQLIQYSYRVAGTVGGMMCGVLGVEHPKAIQHAIDLGIAMQLTNICRDVLEDLNNDRIYLPSEYLKNKSDWRDPHNLELVQNEIENTLELADKYYQSGRNGFRYIPFWCRFGIHVAAYLYQGIGHKLKRKHHANPMLGRCYLTHFEKALVITKACFTFVKNHLFYSRQTPEHQLQLHAPLRDVL